MKNILLNSNRILQGNNLKAFTLAEVVIVVGIIGIIAEFTIPQLVYDIQEKVLKSQFQKAYSLLSNMILKANADMGPFDCFYWEFNPYGAHYCAEYSADGYSCTKLLLKNTNEPLPNDYNGRMTNCSDFKSWFESSMNIVKKCANNSYANGCISNIKGVDTLMVDLGKTEEEAKGKTAGFFLFRKDNLQNYDTSYVFKDGTYMVLYGNSFTPPLFVFDINGQKKPNKWGYDIFTFMIKGNLYGTIKINCAEYGIEPGGKTCSEMMLNSP